MKIINLTPHEVILKNDYLNIKFPPSGVVARINIVPNIEFVDYEIDEKIKISLPVQCTYQIQVVNLPEPQEDTYFIVSSMVASTVKRPDLLSPLTDTSAERDEQGKIISVKKFQTFSNKIDIEFVEDKEFISVGGEEN